MSVAATALGVVSFALTEHIAWAWLAIAALLLLVVSLGWELWRVEHRSDPSASEIKRTLDRAIADGQTIGRMDSGVAQWQEYERWFGRVAKKLRDQVGLQVAHDFGAADHGAEMMEGRMQACIAYLEELRARQ